MAVEVVVGVVVVLALITIGLKKFRKGEIASSSMEEFRPIFERFCERYNAHPSHSTGSFPSKTSWDFNNGWRKG